MKNASKTLPAEEQTDVVRVCLHLDAIVEDVAGIAVQMENYWRFDRQCIVVVAAQSVAEQTEDHAVHLVELQMALAIFGKSSLAVEVIAAKNFRFRSSINHNYY